MDYEIARTYIFRTPSKHKEYYSVRRNLSSGGLMFSIFALSSYSLTWLAYTADALKDTVAILQITILSLLPIIALLSVILQKRRAIKVSEEKIGQKKHDVAVGRAKGRAGGMIGAAAAVVFTSQISLDDGWIPFIISGTLFTMFSFIMTTIFYYKLYLLKKYCPDLAGETDYDKHLKYLK